MKVNTLANIFGLGKSETDNAIIDAYVELFGEEYRQIITERINNVTLVAVGNLSGQNAVSEAMEKVRIKNIEVYTTVIASKFAKEHGISEKQLLNQQGDLPANLLAEWEEYKEEEIKSFTTPLAKLISQLKESEQEYDQVVKDAETELEDEEHRLFEEFLQKTSKMYDGDLASLWSRKKEYESLKSLDQEKIYKAFLECLRSKTVGKKYLPSIIESRLNFNSGERRAIAEQFLQEASERYAKIKEKHDNTILSVNKYIYQIIEIIKKMDLNPEIKSKYLAKVPEYCNDKRSAGFTHRYRSITDGSVKAFIAIKVYKMNDNVILHELLHAISCTKTSMGFEFGEIDDFELKMPPGSLYRINEAFNEIVTDWFTNKIIQNLNKKGKSIIGGEFKSNYQKGFQFLGRILDKYQKQVLECYITGDITAIERAIGESNLNKLIEYSDYLLNHYNERTIKELEMYLQKNCPQVQVNYSDLFGQIFMFYDEIVSTNIPPNLRKLCECIKGFMEIEDELVYNVKTETGKAY